MFCFVLNTLTDVFSIMNKNSREVILHVDEWYICRQTLHLGIFMVMISFVAYNFISQIIYFLD
jgi:hypothetical protein